MSPGEAPGLPWLSATITVMRPETAGVMTLALDVPGWPAHLAGQHLDLRLTAPDGYQAQRSYSIASAPGGETLEITVERVQDGEVSPFLIDETRIGDRIEVRGPIGGYFTWEPGRGDPLLLVAGGSGIAPLMAILRARAAAGDRSPAHLLYSSRDEDAIIYRDELDRLAGVTVTHTLTRAQPSGWTGEACRIDRAMLERHGFADAAAALAFVCGPTGLVEQVAADLVALGYSPDRVKTERFGPTG